VLTKFQDIAEAGVQVVNTDVPGAMLPTLLDLATKARNQPITTLELVPDVVDTVYPDFDIIHALVDSTIQGAATAAK
jgi:hypothetical protein